MGPLYNFGMLSAGVPDFSQREATTAVMDPTQQRAAYLANWQTQYAGLQGTGSALRKQQSALNQQKAAELAKFAPQQAAYILNQTQQQEAYNDANGGTYLGGLINANYATPQTGLQPGSQIGNQVAGYLSGANTSNQFLQQAPMAPQGAATQPSGWGGPFTGKNPWALS